MLLPITKTVKLYNWIVLYLQIEGKICRKPSLSVSFLVQLPKLEIGDHQYYLNDFDINMSSNASNEITLQPVLT